MGNENQTRRRILEFSRVLRLFISVFRRLVPVKLSFVLLDANLRLLTQNRPQGKTEYAVSIDKNDKKVYILKVNGEDTYSCDTTWQDKLTSYNGQSITYDASGNPTSYLGHTLTWEYGRQLASYDSNTYTYDENGNRTSKTSNGVTSEYYLDGTRLVEQTDETNTLHFNYDRTGEVMGFTHYYLSTGVDDPIMAEYMYVKNAQGDIVGITSPSGKMKVSYTYDSLNRLLKTSLQTTASTPIEITYSYCTSGRNGEGESLYQTTQIRNETIDGKTYRYDYDKNGNITKIYEKTASDTNYVLKQSYSYDSLGQLVRVNDKNLNKTILYTYDNGGNMLSQKEYAYTTGTVGTATKTVSYGYNNSAGCWGDKLRSITTDGTKQSFTYDKIGNPLTYRDGMSFTWQGRQMKTADLNGTAVSYKYNSDGLRSYKKVGSTVHEYEYLGDKLMYEKRGSYKFHYRYDAFGNLAGITREDASGSLYRVYVLCNSRGDVLELRNQNGTVFAKYVYDAWGNVLHVLNSAGNEITSTTNLANQNPFRYRGYYYDSESGLYYVSSRYYDPEVCRFISADTTDVLDVQGDLHDVNLYAYCDNNPVTRADNGGEVWVTVGIMAVGGAIGAAISAVSSAVTQYAFNGSVNWKSVGVAAVGGFASGAIAASPLGLGGQIGAGALIGGASYIADCKLNSKPVKADGLVVSTVGGAFSGWIGGRGADHHRVLTNTVNSSRKTIAKYSAKSNTAYAAKKIAATKAYRNSTLATSAWSSSARYTAGTSVSNTISQTWTKVKSWFSGLFK